MAALVVLFCQCQNPQSAPESSQEVVAEPAPESLEPHFTLTREQTHNKFSSTIEPVVTVPSGAIVEAFTEEATDQQLKLNSSIEDLENVSFDPVHPLTGPVFVEGAQPGDMLAVTLHEIEIGSWGWTAVIPGFGFLADRFDQYALKTYDLEGNNKVLDFNDQIKIPLKPFPGVMGVAPATDSLLNTIPPRANGGNMDNPYLTKGTTVYFPVLVEGGLFSIGDTHAVQGLGEVCGTAVEAPMRIVYEIELIKGRTIPEPQYETADYYAVTAFGTTLDIAAKKATEFMVDHLVHQRLMTEEEAYMLCSLAGDLHIAEVVDVPHVLVAMHMPKNIFK